MDQVPNTFPYLFYGYLVVWVLLGGYLLSLGMRLRRLESELRDRYGKGEK